MWRTIGSFSEFFKFKMAISQLTAKLQTSVIVVRKKRYIYLSVVSFPNSNNLIISFFFWIDQQVFC